jgi:colanic acid biosynthesis glycosyl transferase WcaI
MRLLVLGINYAPERTSVAPFTTGLCEHLVARGHEVTVVTAFPYYPEWRVWDGYRGHFYRKETQNGVRVLRVWHYVPRRPSRLVERLAHDFSFSVNAFLAGLTTGNCDLIYCACPPPSAALAAYGLSRIKGTPYVIKLTDLASDAAVATGIVGNGFAIRMARGIERFIYDKATKIACLCRGFIDKLTKIGVPPTKLHLIPDWADTESVRPLSTVSPFRRVCGVLENQFLILHTGNMGKKQDLVNVVRTAELSQGDSRLVWMLIGDGEERQQIEKETSRLKLTNIKLLPLQPAQLLQQMYSAADVLLLNQKATVEDSVIPSKLLTYMAAGRPVIAAVSERSEAARHICTAHSGIIVRPEDPSAILYAALRLRQDPKLRRELGANGRRYALKHFTKSKVLHDYQVFFRPWLGENAPDLFESEAMVSNVESRLS